MAMQVAPGGYGSPPEHLVMRDFYANTQNNPNGTHAGMQFSGGAPVAPRAERVYHQPEQEDVIPFDQDAFNAAAMEVDEALIANQLQALQLEAAQHGEAQQPPFQFINANDMIEALNNAGGAQFQDFYGGQGAGQQGGMNIWQA